MSLSPLPLVDTGDRRAQPGTRSRRPRSRRRCSSCPAAAPSPQRSCWPRSARSAASKRRTACPPQRRRTARSKLRQQPTAPPRPRRQPPTQRRALPNRDHPSSPTPPPAPTSNAKQAEGKSRREAIRCLKRTPRPHRLQHPESEPGLDIGATLAQPSAITVPPRPRDHDMGSASGDVAEGLSIDAASLILRHRSILQMWTTKGHRSARPVG